MIVVVVLSFKSSSKTGNRAFGLKGISCIISNSYIHLPIHTHVYTFIYRYVCINFWMSCCRNQIILDFFTHKYLVFNIFFWCLRAFCCQKYKRINEIIFFVIPFGGYTDKDMSSCNFCRQFHGGFWMKFKKLIYIFLKVWVGRIIRFFYIIKFRFPTCL